ncbi:MAG TPA: hypothetical protein VIK60_18640 [Vicinamibacterales bacterium]
MRGRIVSLMLLVLPLAVAAYAQDDRQRVVTRYEANVGDKKFDPRDLSGIWTLTRNDHSLGTPAPPLTPAGAAAKAGRRADTPGAFGNAPWYACNPMGFPRLLNDDEPMELVMLPNRILQLFQWEHRVRVLWTDGRNVPSGEHLENLGPAWYGHSVARWNGNTLVVNTVGLDERAWLDNQGNPKSFRARIEETWRRVDANTLELQLTLYDPEYYTAPYVGSKKTYKRMPDDAITYFGWYGLYAGITEGICAPMNEVEGYNKEFRDPGRAAKP